MAVAATVVVAVVESGSRRSSSTTLLLVVVVVAAVDARPQVSGPWASQRIEVDSERRRKAPAHPCRRRYCSSSSRGKWK